MDPTLIPPELLSALLRAAGLVVVLWQGVKAAADEASLTLPKWAVAIGPRVFTLGLFLVFALPGGFATADLVLGGLVALFASNVLFDATKGVVAKLFPAASK